MKHLLRDKIKLGDPAASMLSTSMQPEATLEWLTLRETTQSTEFKASMRSMHVLGAERLASGTLIASYDS